MKEHRLLGWTTLEEAKKLVEAGLDPNTADMCYLSYIDFDDKDFRVYGINARAYKEMKRETKEFDFVPCWSLGNLFNIAYTIVEDDWFCLEKDVKKNYITDYIITSIHSTMFKYDTLMETCVYFVTELLKRRNFLKNE